jgi:hypothetical protein
VVIASRKQEGLDTVAASINADFPDRVVLMACHVGQIDKISACWAQLAKQVGPKDPSGEEMLDLLRFLMIQRRPFVRLNQEECISDFRGLCSYWGKTECQQEKSLRQQPFRPRTLRPQGIFTSASISATTGQRPWSRMGDSWSPSSRNVSTA